NSILEEPSFLRRGVYLPQIKRYHDLFGKDKVLIIGFKDLKDDKKIVLNRVLEFLNVEHSEWDFISDEKKNVRSYPTSMTHEMETKFKAFYVHYNTRLVEYVGYKIKWC